MNKNTHRLSICFLGPDGSGKSTIIESLVGHQLKFEKSEYFHLKPIRKMSDDETKSVVLDPHKLPAYGRIKSYIKLFYFVFQYNLGWYRNIYKSRMQSSLIVFDRYYDDILVDTKRYRYGGNIILAKIVRIFIPKPDIYFILTTDAKVIYGRKQEVPFEELKRQIHAYEALVDGKRYFHIDVNRSVEEITKEIITIMMEKMNERY